MSEKSSTPLRIAIIGGCQVVGLSAAAKVLLPDAEASSWHVGVHPSTSDDDLLELLPNFDVVISQLSDWDDHVSLRVSRLRERRLPLIYVPVIAFPGFHPDITYIRGPGGLVPGFKSDYHSIIIASAFVLGLPSRRVPGLFNAFVFSTLGYFDAFDEAKVALFDVFARENFDIRPIFDMWLQRVGQFMYTINHPHILVLSPCATSL